MKIKLARIFPSRMAKLEIGAMRRASSVSLVCSRENEGLQHQRTGEQERDPQKAGAVAARFGGSGIKSEAEEHDHDQGENDGGAEQFARAEFEAQLLCERRLPPRAQWSS